MNLVLFIFKFSVRMYCKYIVMGFFLIYMIQRKIIKDNYCWNLGYYKVEK